MARLDGWLSFAVALLAMYGVVTFVVEAARHVWWAVPAGLCLALAAYCCTRVYNCLFWRR